MSVAAGKPADLSYIIHLSKLHAEELGFLTRGAMAAYLARDRVTVARENGEPCGYFLASGLAPRVRIFQACVQYDARGLAHGIDLLSELVAKCASTGVKRITLHCRDGLESNGFWSACGFESAGLLLGGHARKKIIHEWSLPIRSALANPSLPYARRFFTGLRPGTIQRASPPAGSSQS